MTTEPDLITVTIRYRSNPHGRTYAHVTAPGHKALDVDAAGFPFMGGVKEGKMAQELIPGEVHSVALEEEGPGIATVIIRRHNVIA